MIALITIIAGFAYAFWKARADADRPLLTRVDAETIIQGNRGNIERCLNGMEDAYFFLDFYISQDQDAGINVDIVPLYRSPPPSTYGIEHPRIYVDEAKGYDGVEAVRRHLNESEEQKLSITSPDVNFCLIDAISDEIRAFKLSPRSAFIHRYVTDSCCGV